MSTLSTIAIGSPAYENVAALTKAVLRAPLDASSFHQGLHVPEVRRDAVHRPD